MPLNGPRALASDGKNVYAVSYTHLDVYKRQCFQNCRRAYRVTDEETGNELVIDNKYVMSPRDLCTVPVLDQLLDCLLYTSRCV